MKDFFQNNTNSLQEIKQKLRLMLNNSNLFESIYDNIYLVLYTLILKKDGILKGIHKENSAIIIDLIRDRLFQLKNVSDLKALVHHNLEWCLNKVDENEFYVMVTTINSFDKQILNLHFTEIFDDLLERAAKIQGPKTGQFYQPAELSHLLVSLAGDTEKLSIFNPFAGLASFNVHFPGSCKYIGTEYNGNIWVIGALRICAYNHDDNAVFLNEDSSRYCLSSEKKLDLIISNPPFGKMINPNNGNTSILSVESYIIQNGLKNLNETGKIILTVSNGFLFSSKENRIKKHLIENDLLESIITFPGGLLINTSIPFSVIVINLAKKNKGIVKFIDGKGFVGVTNRKEKKIQTVQLLTHHNSGEQSEFIKFVTNSDIIEQDFNLSVNRYFTKKTSGVPLAEFLTAIKPTKSDFKQTGIEVKIGDLKSDPVTYFLETDLLNVVELSDRYYKINKSCVLVSSLGNKLKPTFFKYKGVPIYVSKDIFSFVVNEKKIAINYLIVQLSSTYFTDQLESIKNGATIQYFNRTDFLNLVIEIHPLNEQLEYVNRFIREFNLSKLKEFGLERALEDSKTQQKQDLSIKKHNIMQHLNNLKSGAYLIQKKSIENNGIVNLNQIIDKKNNLSLSDIYTGMLASIDNVLYYVDNLTNEINFHKAEDVDLIELVKIAIAKAKKDPELFNIEFTWDKKSLVVSELEDPDTGKAIVVLPIIKFSKNDFFELFNNILENAINHGFTDSSKKYIFRIRLEANMSDGKLKLSFSNNGNPFPNGMAERYSIKGEKAGKFSNNGIGSWKVYEIAKHFGCDLIVDDFAEDEFPVNINLIIPFGSNEI